MGELRDRADGAGTEAVGNAKNGERSLASGDETGESARAELYKGVADPGLHPAVEADEGFASDADHPSLDDPLDAQSGPHATFGGALEGEALPFRLVHNHLGEGMLGVEFNGGGIPENRRGIEAVGVTHLGEARLALGEGAGFVEGDGPALAEDLDGVPSLEEHAAARAAGDGGEHGGGDREDEGAGRGHHHEGHGAVEAEVPTHAHEKTGAEEGEERAHEDDPGVGSPIFLDEALGRGLLVLGLVDDAEDLGERGVAGLPVGLHADQAMPVDASREHASPRALVHRHGFAGEATFVHGGDPVEDHAVPGNPLTGVNEDHIANMEGGDGNDLLLPVAQDRGFGRAELHQGADRAAGAPARIALEGAAEGEEEHQHRALRFGANTGRAKGGEDHQEVDIESKPAEILEHAKHREKTTREIGKDVEGMRDMEGKVGQRALAHPPGHERGEADDRKDKLNAQLSAFAHLIGIHGRGDGSFLRTTGAEG